MAPLLQYLAEITAHRDHHLQDVSVVSALHQLTRSNAVRLFEIFPFRENLCLRPKVWTCAETVVSAEEGAWEEQKEPLGDHPLLAACVEQHRHSVEQRNSDGSFVLWFPIRLNEEAVACLELCAV